MSARTLIESPTRGGYFGGTDSRGDWVIQPAEDVRAQDHSELGVRRDRWRWSPAVPDMVMWSDAGGAVGAETLAYVEEYLRRKEGAVISRHRGIDSYNTWSGMIERAQARHESEDEAGDPFEFGDNYWIDPDGYFRSTEGVEHLEWAEMAFGEGVDPTTEGWCRVTTEREPSGRKVIFISDAQPSRIQRAALERVAIETEAWLVFDHGTRRGMGTRPETVLYRPPTQEALKIRVPPFAQDAFFQDRGAPEEFWAMRARPQTKAGEMIEFYFGAKPVATAQVSRVEPPGQSACGHSGKFGAKWKVHWQGASFRKLGEALAVDDDTPVVGTITLDGDVRFKQTWKQHSEAGLGRGYSWRYAPSTLRVYWWDNDDRTPEREVAVTDALEADGFKVRGHAEMLPQEDAEEMKGWHAAHATHARGRAKTMIEADAEVPYQGHDAPSMGDGGGSPLHNVVGAYPPDVYSHVGERFYSSGHRLDSRGYALIQSYKNRPNRILTVYRAVPKDVKAGINPGDWVTPIRPYAMEHGRDNLRNEFRIVSKQVHARDLFTSGNSWLEWGYDPQPRDLEADRLRNERRRAKYAAQAAGADAGTGATPSAPVSEAQGAPWGDVGYRAYNYNPPKGASVADIVTYEAEELGNDDILLQAEATAAERGLELAKIPARDAVWVTRTREEAMAYAHSGDASDVKAYNIAGWVPLVDLGEDGGLLVKPPRGSEGSR